MKLVKGYKSIQGGMMDVIDCTDRPKVEGKALLQLINDRFWKTQEGAILRPYPHKLRVTNEQFSTINGGNDTRRNRKLGGPIDHTGTPAYLLEVEVVDV